MSSTTRSGRLSRPPIRYQPSWDEPDDINSTERTVGNLGYTEERTVHDDRKRIANDDDEDIESDMEDAAIESDEEEEGDADGIHEEMKDFIEPDEDVEDSPDDDYIPTCLDHNCNGDIGDGSATPATNDDDDYVDEDDTDIDQEELKETREEAIAFIQSMSQAPPPAPIVPALPIVHDAAMIDAVTTEVSSVPMI